MSKTTAVVLTLMALLGLGGLVYAYNARPRPAERVVVVPSPANVTVATAQSPHAHVVAADGSPTVVGSMSRAVIAPRVSAPVAPPMTGPALMGAPRPPTSVPGYLILDDTGNELTLEDLRDDPQPVTLYLQRGDVNIPIRLDSDAGAVMAARAAVATEQQQGSTDAAAPASSSTAMERALASMGILSDRILPEPAMKDARALPRSADFFTAAPAFTDGFGMNSFGRGMPYSYIQSYDANGNLGWRRMNFTVGSNGVYTPYGLSYLNPTAISSEQSLAGSRADNSLAIDQVQQGEFAGERAAQSDASARGW